MRKKGFTLIELLVVIGIIAVLAAIIFPVFVKAKEKARQVTCISNMKQIVMAVSEYVSDYEGALPPSAYWLPEGEIPVDPVNSPPMDDNRYPVYTLQILAPYIGKAGTLSCPNSLYQRKDPWFGNYGFNAGCGYNESLFIDWTQIPISRGGQAPEDPKYYCTLTYDADIPNPAAVYAVMDTGAFRFNAEQASSILDGPIFLGDRYNFYIPGTGQFIGDDKQPDPATVEASFQEVSNDYNNGRHNGGIIVGFCDGHVKWVTCSEIVNQANIMCGELGAYGPALDAYGINVSNFYYARP